eukprot:2681844-Amphidinium_carterae.1
MPKPKLYASAKLLSFGPESLLPQTDSNLLFWSRTPAVLKAPAVAAVLTPAEQDLAQLKRHLRKGPAAMPSQLPKPFGMIAPWQVSLCD